MRRGFTLIETIMGLFLLGLITVIVLPLVNGNLDNLFKQRVKAQMAYTGEMVVEMLKAYDEETSNPLFIYDVEIGQIIDKFKGNNYIEINLDKEDYEFPIKIIKEDKSDLLWTTRVIVYSKGGGKLDNVEFKAYLQKK
ncbi:MAG: prepilin-type N-terminal cleavage/methylation domain-containing protein [Tissierellia bacterium]|nr:prepilin-type N-terminal cleavage/methylation domain-containing protein [Tissierellia bacterium]